MCIPHNAVSCYNAAVKKNSVYKCIVLILAYILSSASQMLCMKAAIGVVPVWDAITANLTEITGIKVGYFSVALNVLTILLWFIVLGKDFRPARLLSALVIFCLGPLQNFFYYDVYTFEITSYAMRIALLFAGNFVLAIALGFITYIDLIAFPLEGLCYTLERKYRFNIKITRTLLDVICILVSLALSLFFHLSLKVREGTVISMLLVGPVMGLTMDFIRKCHWFENR